MNHVNNVLEHIPFSFTKRNELPEYTKIKFYNEEFNPVNYDKDLNNLCQNIYHTAQQSPIVVKKYPESVDTVMRLHTKEINYNFKQNVINALISDGVIPNVDSLFGIYNIITDVVSETKPSEQINQYYVWDENTGEDKLVSDRIESIECSGINFSSLAVYIKPNNKVTLLDGEVIESHLPILLIISAVDYHSINASNAYCENKEVGKIYSIDSVKVVPDELIEEKSKQMIDYLNTLDYPENYKKFLLESLNVEDGSFENKVILTAHYFYNNDLDLVKIKQYRDDLVRNKQAEIMDAQEYIEFDKPDFYFGVEYLVYFILTFGVVTDLSE